MNAPAENASFEVARRRALEGLERSLERLQTPAYVYDDDLLRLCVARYRGLFPERAKHFYSLKANAQTALLKRIAEYGFGMEIASAAEAELCRAAGIDRGRLILGGAARTDELLAAPFADALAALVVDSVYELERLLREPIRSRPIVRLASPDSPFGLSLTEILDVAARSPKRPSFRGLHVHAGSQKLSVDAITMTLDLLEEALCALRRENFPVELAIFGSGCGVPYLAGDAELDWPRLRNVLHERMQRPPFREIDIWTEAGRAIVAEAGFYVTRVRSIKRVAGHNVAMLDGGLHVHNPGYGLGRFFVAAPRLATLPRRAYDSPVPVSLQGALCTPADLLAKDVPLPPLRPGDCVVVENSGAYVMTSALWGFNRQRLFSEYYLASDGATADLRALRPQWRLEATA